MANALYFCWFKQRTGPHLRELGRLVAVLGALSMQLASPIAAAERPYAGVLSSEICAPGVAFTVASMGWDHDYIESSNFEDLGPCVVPDLAALLGEWQLVSQQIEAGAASIVGNSAGKTLRIKPAAAFENNAAVRGVVAEEDWTTEKFCAEGAANSPFCSANLPALPVAAGPMSCRDSAEFTGKAHVDVYIHHAAGAAGEPVPPFAIRANARRTLAPVNMRCPGAQTDVNCPNCASMSIGNLTMLLEYDRQADTLVAISDMGGRRLVQSFRRVEAWTIEQFFTPDGSLRP